EDGIRDYKVTGVQTCALPIFFFLLARQAGAVPGRLQHGLGRKHAAEFRAGQGEAFPGSLGHHMQQSLERRASALYAVILEVILRSEERRVGKECRSRWVRDD